MCRRNFPFPPIWVAQNSWKFNYFWRLGFLRLYIEGKYIKLSHSRNLKQICKHKSS
jgi:hypothetical protein